MIRLREELLTIQDVPSNNQIYSTALLREQSHVATCLIGVPSLLERVEILMAYQNQYSPLTDISTPAHSTTNLSANLDPFGTGTSSSLHMHLSEFSPYN